MSASFESGAYSLERSTIQIADKGKILTLDYDGARASHGGDALWGVAVGFRAMQVAADKLSQTKLWERDRLSVVSGHPGPGVRDAINYVTRCVERRRFSLFEDQAGATNCSRDMKYEWWLSNDQTAVAVILRSDFVPELFFNLLDRLGSEQELAKDRSQLDALKADLEARIWHEPLAVSFRAESLPVSAMRAKLPGE